MYLSFNAALDYAYDVGADLLLHTGSDVIAESFALNHLLSAMDPDLHYLSVGRGFDILNGQGAAVGLWVFNMRILGREFRFRDVFKQDLDLCNRIEEGTKTTRTYIGFGTPLGYHHPIWTPREMYMKLRYGAAKYDKRKQDQYQRFLEDELTVNPNNKVLRAGLIGLEKTAADPHVWGSKDPTLMEGEYHDLSRDLRLRGTEYYVYHRRFKRLAQALYHSIDDCVTIEDRQSGPEEEPGSPDDHG